MNQSAADSTKIQLPGCMNSWTPQSAESTPEKTKSKNKKEEDTSKSDDNDDDDGKERGSRCKGEEASERICSCRINVSS